MKLIGNPNGMRLYPEMIKEVAPTNHKYGADLTVSYHTDTYKPTLEGHGIDAEINAFKYNFQGTILVSPSTDEVYKDEIINVLETGRFSSGIYFRAFLEDVQGQVDFYNKITGKDASYWSYGNGIRDHDDFALEHSLLTRRSGGGQVSYDFDTRLEHTCATLFNYNVRDKGMVSALATAETMINKAILENGWYNDFSHWHWADVHGDKDQLEQFFSQQNALLNGVNYVSLGSGEAVEYMWLRKQFKRGGIYQKGDGLVLICDVKNDDNLPYSAISQTLSVEVDVTDTVLANRELEATSDILKVSENKFIVQVPYNRRDGFSAVHLNATSNPKYLDLSLPNLISSDTNENKINIVSDKKTKAVLFKIPTGGSLYQAEVVERSQEYSEKHTFTTVSGYDSYVGLITKAGQSTLTKIL